MSVPNCCPTKLGPVHSEYLKRGVVVEDATVDNYYIIGDGPRGIVFIPDIFGCQHPNVHQISDILAGRGFQVIVPDVYRRKPWPTDKFPPSEHDGFSEFIKRVQQTDPFVADVEYAATVLKSRGVTSIGAIGMCAGAKVALLANARKIVSCAAGPHPSFLNVEDGKNATGPICLLPGKEDPPLLDVKEALDAQPFAAKNVFRRFDNLHHGYLGARGHYEKASDYSNKETFEATMEALETIINFFGANL